MTKTTLILICLFCCKSYLSNAQIASFLFSGTIEYEKTINMHARVKQMIGPNATVNQQKAFENYVRTQPKFDILKSSLKFTSGKSVFTPEKQPVNLNALYFGEDPLAVQPNIVYSDYRTKRSVVQKKVFNELFLVKDTLPTIIWKLVDETRDIAGYSCRRANGLIMDSIYVVAFYSEEIRVSSGPESFTGLPGMILGVALPDEHVTWFAKLVTPQLPEISAAIVEPTNGKAVSRSGFKELLVDRFKIDVQILPRILKGNMF